MSKITQIYFVTKKWARCSSILRICSSYLRWRQFFLLPPLFLLHRLRFLNLMLQPYPSVSLLTAEQVWPPWPPRLWPVSRPSRRWLFPWPPPQVENSHLFTIVYSVRKRRPPKPEGKSRWVKGDYPHVLARSQQNGCHSRHHRSNSEEKNPSVSCTWWTWLFLITQRISFLAVMYAQAAGRWSVFLFSIESDGRREREEEQSLGSSYSYHLMLLLCLEVEHAIISV